MTLGHARVIKGGAAPARAVDLPRARRIAAAAAAAREEADRIVAEAKASAAAIGEAAAREARELAVAELAAGFLQLRSEDEARAARDVDRVIGAAVLLAERLIGESLRVAPSLIGELAASVIAESRGARRVQIEASPDDAAALASVLASVGYEAEIETDASLGRGSLVVHTDLGGIDARLAPQLRRLADALRQELA